MKKVRVHITKTTVNAPTYSNVTFEPTLINTLSFITKNPKHPSPFS